ncbi:chlorhexidine efflux transporter [Burkholderia ubonensis]|uniref:chlorhexidine efflux transporter n=1 Tax=Burkholderia ubonensis TaxID=101571 RepID=UPI003F74DC6B
MQGLPRKITQAILYEAIAIACISPAIAALFGEGLVYSGALSATMSAIALLWWSTTRCSNGGKRRACSAPGRSGAASSMHADSKAG